MGSPRWLCAETANCELCRLVATERSQVYKNLVDYYICRGNAHLADEVPEFIGFVHRNAEYVHYIQPSELKSFLADINQPMTWRAGMVECLRVLVANRVFSKVAADCYMTGEHYTTDYFDDDAWN